MWFRLQTTILSLLLSGIYPKWYTQYIWEDFINISSVWKRTQENFCDQHPVLGTKMPCSALPVIRRQWPSITAESVSALMENLSRFTQDGVTHICELRVGHWKQGGWATQNARRVGVGHPCQGTSSCHWTHDKTQGTSLRKNSSWIGQAWKGKSDQCAGDHAMCHLPCSLMFSKIQCYYAGLCVCLLQYTYYELHHFNHLAI